jgi:hypothetical protein
MLRAVLTAESDQDRSPAHAAVSAFMMSSGQLLAQLRDGLVSRSIAKPEAERLQGGTEHALKQADKRLWQVLPVKPGTPSGQQTEDLKAVVSDTRRQLPGLRAKIARLFDEAGENIPYVPAPRG